jgi:hypothetical protein
MRALSLNRLAGRGRFGTRVPKPRKAFGWNEETIRTICSIGRFRKT